MDKTPHRRRRRLSAAIISALLCCAIVLSAGCGELNTPVVNAEPAQQRGFALPSWQVRGYDGPDVEQSLEEVKSVGATWVQFTPTWYQDDTRSSSIERTSGTVSDTGLRRAITVAHQLGLKVLLKPHVDLPVPGQNSRNNILPEDRPAWFAAYTDFIRHYAAIAQETGVAQFAMGTELSSLTDDREPWVRVVDAVRGEYDGVVLYAAGRDYATVSFWDVLDMIGIDAYLALGSEPTTDVATLARAWQPAVEQLSAMSAQYGKRILFTEAGYTSQQGTITDPSNWRISNTVSEAEQAAAYQALLSTFTPQLWWAGVFWWVWITPPYTVAEPKDFSPKGKEAETIVRHWWTE